MPPRDLECHLFCGDGERDRAVLFDSDTEEELCEDPYAPAESLRLRIGEDIDWSDVGAVAVLERDDSTKDAGANPKSAARRSAAGRSSVSGTAPRKVVVVIGGLGLAAGKVAREHGRRRSPCRLGGRARVFAAGDAVVVDHQAEPGSPKVSCLGGVRSSSELKPAAGEGIRRRGRWAWLVANVTSCWSARGGGEAK